MRFIISFSLFLLICGCNNEGINNSGNNKTTIINCNLEDIGKAGDKVKYTERNTTIKGGELNSTFSKSGSFSAMINKENPFGLSCQIKTNPGDKINVQVYRKGNSGKIILSNDSNDYYQRSKMAKQEKIKGDTWDLLTVNITIPFWSQTNQTRIYLYNNKKEAVYFDDLKITIVEGSHSNESKNTLDLTIDSVTFSILRKRRTEAMNNSIIQKKQKKYFDLGIINNMDTTHSKARFKGDWTDHINGDKWSYRIKLPKGNFFKKWRSFSIQHPKTRSYLHEWIFHKLLEKEDLLTTDYDFIPVNINNNYSGVYAIEEHFEKQLVESKNRREGPIIKLSEDAMWASKKLEMEEGKPNKIPYFNASVITPFKKKSTIKDSLKYNQFLYAQNLLESYKNFSNDINTIFDIDKLAKTFALFDIGKIDHSFTWHNQRWYFNPIINKLEMVVFDCYGSEKPEHSNRPTILGMLDNSAIKSDHQFLVMNLFNNKDFLQKYSAYLTKFSNKNYLLDFFKEIDHELENVSSLLKTEYLFYDYSTNFLHENAEKIRENLTEFQNKIKSNNILFTLKRNTHTYNYTINKEVVSNLVTFHTSKNDVSFELTVKNHLYKKINLISYVSKKGEIHDFSAAENEISPMDKISSSKIIYCKEKPKKILFTIDKESVVFESKPLPWPSPKKITKEEPLSFHNLKTKEDTIIIRGKHTFSKDLIVKDKILKVEAGATINLINGAGITSEMAVLFLGSHENPIKIYSSDFSSSGIHVIQAKEGSKVINTYVSGLNTLRDGQKRLTGALTFYESDVIFDNCNVDSNLCEDAINVIRSNFSFRNSSVSNSFSDGLDADFCSGKVTNCTFKNIGNDALDFSGSDIKITNVTINNAKDKGISGGEQSTLEITQTSVQKANLGIVSKDESKIDCHDIYISNCDIGFGVFKKKAEYGPSALKVNDYTINNVTQKSILDKRSTISFDDKIFTGNTTLNIDSLYQYKIN